MSTSAPIPPEAPAPDTRLWNRNFTVYWLATVQSVFGNALSSVVVAVLVFEMTGKPSAMGLTLALGMLPTLISPFAGVVVDRVPLKPLLIIASLLEALLVGSLAYMVAGGEPSLLWLNIVVLLGGLVAAFTSPAGSTLLPELVPETQLARANGLLATGRQTAQIVGLLAGTGLVALLGATQTLALDALTFLIMAAALLLVRLPPRAKVGEQAGMWASFLQGLGVLRSYPGFAMIPVLAFVINIAFAPVQMLIPEHLTRLGLSEAQYGAAVATVLGGMVLGGLGITALGERFRPQLSLWLGLGIAGLALLGMANIWAVAAFFVCAALLGFGISLVNTAIAYLGQTLIPAEFRGRVFGLINAVGQAGLPFALIALGPVADIWGSQVLWSASGALVLVATAYALKNSSKKFDLVV